MPGKTYTVGQIMALDQKVNAILKDILGHDTNRELQERTGRIHIHETKIGKDVMDKSLTSDARADTAVKQAVIAELLERLPEDIFFNPTLYDPDSAIKRLAALLLRPGENDTEEPTSDMPDIANDTETQ